MARRVFFSFHFQRDSWRVSQVRNSNIVTSKYQRNDFLDSADWENLKKSGEKAIENWINKQLEGTSVTVVLIGKETSERKFVQYEIKKSYEKGNGLIGIYIHGLKNSLGLTDTKGANPFDKFHLGSNSTDLLSRHIKTYDWILDNGREKIGDWIEEAARQAGR